MQIGLPFLNGVAGKKRNQMICVDLGSRTTKAVLLERRGEIFALLRYVLLDAPIFEKTLSPELLAEHLKAVHEALGAKTRFVTLSIGVNDAIVRPVELPQIPVDEMRLVLKNNTRGYLQQDLPNRVFDCHIIPPKVSSNPADAGKAGTIPKLKVLVAGAKKELVSDLQTAIRGAGLVADRRRTEPATRRPRKRRRYESHSRFRPRNRRATAAPTRPQPDLRVHPRKETTHRANPRR